MKTTLPKAVLALCIGLAPALAPAREPELKSVEVKALVKAMQVVQSEDGKLADAQPSRALLEHLQAQEAPEELTLWFLDDERQSLQEQGWTIRLRQKGDAPELEVVFKRRYLVEENGGLEGALAEFRREAIGLPDPKDAKTAKLELDWSGERQILSASFEPGRKLPLAAGEASPKLEDVRDYIRKSAPSPLLEAAAGVLETARLYGPIRARRWKGEWIGLSKAPKLELEVWATRTAPDACSLIAEISFKKEAAPKESQKKLLAKAGALRAILLGETEPWLDHSEPKTSLVLRRYAALPDPIQACE